MSGIKSGIHFTDIGGDHGTEQGGRAVKAVRRIKSIANSNQT